MLNWKRLKLVAWLVAVVLAPGGLTWAGQDAGTVRLTKALKYQGKIVAKGSYKLSVEDANDGPTLVLATAAGETVVSELAIVQESKHAVKKAHASVHLVTRGGPFVRLLVSAGTKKYWAFFEPAS